ncbi:probable g-protein coupled receptor [Lynx pardinus]|uniref:Probable g-protein coupled receptor n=1 Tax=Lynx pardinus TaxID=191816 RepID=A0A485MWD7_LYNPA|nr:probable g-protein coupled receptor [Lynx pardinus]
MSAGPGSDSLSRCSARGAVAGLQSCNLLITPLASSEWKTAPRHRELATARRHRAAQRRGSRCLCLNRWGQPRDPHPPHRRPEAPGPGLDPTATVWDLDLRDGHGGRRGGGCHIIGSAATPLRLHSGCRSFAGLMDPGEFLHPVVYACTAVMLLCLLASVITYVVHQNAIRISRKGRHTLLNFCFHAALTFTVFAGGVNRTKYPILCQAVGILLHYSTLATMLWIGVTARNIYKQVTKKAPPCPRQPLLRFYLISGGVPFIICGVTAATNIRNYGTEDEDGPYCWMAWEPSLGAFYGPAAFIALVTCVYFLGTYVQLRRHPERRYELRPRVEEQRRLAMREAGHSPGAPPGTAPAGAFEGPRAFRNAPVSFSRLDRQSQPLLGPYPAPTRAFGAITFPAPKRRGWHFHEHLGTSPDSVLVSLVCSCAERSRVLHLRESGPNDTDASQFLHGSPPNQTCPHVSGQKRPQAVPRSPGLGSSSERRRATTFEPWPDLSPRSRVHFHVPRAHLEPPPGAIVAAEGFEPAPQTEQKSCGFCKHWNHHRHLGRKHDLWHPTRGFRTHRSTAAVGGRPGKPEGAGRGLAQGYCGGRWGRNIREPHALPATPSGRVEEAAPRPALTAGPASLRLCPVPAGRRDGSSPAAQASLHCLRPFPHDAPPHSVLCRGPSDHQGRQHGGGQSNVEGQRPGPGEWPQSRPEGKAS